MIPEITCKECGRKYVGWALKWGGKQHCDCGNWLDWDIHIPKIKGGEKIE